MATAVENVECGNSMIATVPYIREFSRAAWFDQTRERLSRLNATLPLVGRTNHTLARVAASPRGPRFHFP